MPYSDAKPDKEAPSVTFKARLKAWEKGLLDFAGADMADPDMRKRAERVVFWLDHGFVRAWWHNFEQIAPGVYRSNQPTRKRLARARAMGIHTVLSLRGDGVQANQVLEKADCADLGLRLITLSLRSSRAPTRDALLNMIAIFREIERPFLMHCKSGADRAALASAIWLMVIEGAPVERAQKMLSLRYAHVKRFKTGVLDALLDTYAARNRQSPIGFEHWVRDEYDADALQAAFNASRKG